MQLWKGTNYKSKPQYSKISPILNQSQTQKEVQEQHYSVTKRQKPPKCPSVNEWINTWYIHSMKYDLTLDRNGVLSYATMWVNFQNTRLRERSQTQRSHIIWFYLYEISKRGKSTETGSKLVAVGGGLGGGAAGEWLMDTVSPLGVIKMFWNQTEVVAV